MNSAFPASSRVISVRVTEIDAVSRAICSRAAVNSAARSLLISMSIGVTCEWAIAPLAVLVL